MLRVGAATTRLFENLSNSGGHNKKSLTSG